MSRSALLFYNRDTQHGQIATLDGFGKFAVGKALSNLGVFTHIRRTPDGGVLFYDSPSGTAFTAILDDEGIFTAKGPVEGLNKGYVCVEPVGRHSLFFHNPKNGETETGVVDSDGNYTSIKIFRIFPNWTHIIGLPNSSILFYNAFSANIGTGRMDSMGNLIVTGFVGQVDRLFNFFRVVSVGENAVMFEFMKRFSDGEGNHFTTPPDGFHTDDQNTGVIVTLDATGMFQEAQALDGFSHWVMISGTPSGGIFFYAAFPGTSCATSVVDLSGNYTFISTFDDFPNSWTHISNGKRAGFGELLSFSA